MFCPHANNKLDELIAALCESPVETWDHDPAPIWTGDSSPVLGLLPTCTGEDLLRMSFKPNTALALPPHVNNNPVVLIALILLKPDPNDDHDPVPICIGEDL